MLPPHAKIPIVHNNAPRSMREESTPQLTLSGFQAALQTWFRLQSPTGTSMELVLVEARALGSASGGNEERSFSVLFHGPADPALPQRMYSFAHEMLGTFDLFIVPVGRDKNGCHYEAVFNHIPGTEH